MDNLSALDAFNPIFPNPLGSVPSPASAVPGAFESTVDELLSNPQAVTPQKTQAILAQSREAQNLALAGMFADPTSSLGSLAGTLGTSGLFSLPSWASDAAALSGDPNMTALLSLYQQEASLVQSEILGQGNLFNGLA